MEAAIEHQKAAIHFTLCCIWCRPKNTTCSGVDGAGVGQLRPRMQAGL